MEKLCYDCPRKCGIDRSIKKGFCGEGDKIRVAKTLENFMWEEPCISGNKGALAIFFSGCNLRCEFCQNFEISHIGKGESYSAEEFRAYLESFDLTRFDSIDLITPTQFSSLLIEALADFNSPIPIVWNSGGYENVEMIKKLAKVVDVFLPDFKFYESELSSLLAKAPNYFEVASEALKAMKDCKKNNIFKDGILTEGVLIRHLVLPGHIKDSLRLLEFIAKEINKPFVSLMGQFTPIRGRIKEGLKPLEYKLILSHAEKLGLSEGYFQELESASENFIPQF